MPDVFARLSEALADRYALDRELGEGGMATVYLAEDLRNWFAELQAKMKAAVT